MKTEDFKALFPLKGNITQEIINKADTYNRKKCIGALTFKSALGELIKRPKLEWANSVGYILVNGIEYAIRTNGNIMMMSVDEPQEVTFNISEVK